VVEFVPYVNLLEFLSLSYKRTDSKRTIGQIGYIFFRFGPILDVMCNFCLSFLKKIKNLLRVACC
jgi:hypothetical protein